MPSGVEPPLPDDDALPVVVVLPVEEEPVLPPVPPLPEDVELPEVVELPVVVALSSGNPWFPLTPQYRHTQRAKPQQQRRRARWIESA
jgi:hypothetical protein